jgi:hypothetical protein
MDNSIFGEAWTEPTVPLRLKEQEFLEVRFFLLDDHTPRRLLRLLNLRLKFRWTTIFYLQVENCVADRDEVADAEYSTLGRLISMAISTACSDGSFEPTALSGK